MCGGRIHSGTVELLFLRELTAEGAHEERNSASCDTMRPSFVSINMPLLLLLTDNAAVTVLHTLAEGALSQKFWVRVVDCTRP